MGCFIPSSQEGYIDMLKLSRRREKSLTVRQKSPTVRKNFADPAENINLSIRKLENVENQHFVGFEKPQGAEFENINFDNINLDTALLIAQTLHIVLRAEDGRLIIWCPGVVVPRDVLRVIRANTSKVLRLIGLSHVSVCPSPELHYHSWHYTVRRDCCDICARLKPWMEGKAA